MTANWSCTLVILLVTLCLLAVATSASAECAWVKWRTGSDVEMTWNILDAFPRLPDCDQSLKADVSRLKRDGYEVHGAPGVGHGVSAQKGNEGATRSRARDRCAGGTRLSDAHRALAPATAQEDHRGQSGPRLRNSRPYRTRGTGATSEARVLMRRSANCAVGLAASCPTLRSGSPVPTPSLSQLAAICHLTLSSVVRSGFYCALGKVKNVRSSWTRAH
jgi:hypothetical protein